VPPHFSTSPPFRITLNLTPLRRLMARQRVDPRHRRRVAQACDGCKRRKAKCNGVVPCDQCSSRQSEDACCYTTQHNRTILRETRIRSTHNDSEVRVALTALGTKPADRRRSPAPDPEASRMLRDAKGKSSEPRYFCTS
jgi:hypothetical protein